MVLEEKYTVKQLRGLRGMTQEELAKKVGVSATTIGEFESKPGRLKNAKYSTIESLAFALQVDIGDIFLDITRVKPESKQEA
ncbi:helix-turn-helix transcriptional regulator [Marinilactibacillus psychrotolerans]|uniref:HTH cro/C1-type domain-containing protein n=1 Tax=Marinilactibacillus psychrotolerans TaxID=191770 RepID=A0AAV3WYR0_9LACT|nr:helix-turn-helix transcriptional regulator [Marinilactibacillus psychrotolerans]GEL67210.1 hypothetical protein MPS01_13650 [Marinilactibacillus psychrotolerans]GEQ36014.1 hypothetical protein M132T_15220 [Marinilactibacillus psychrotolerans]SDC59760.1 DNA-binding transcriptional regulator, XRE-family HTH domain [Marinilactibacillus psychrotolerans]